MSAGRHENWCGAAELPDGAAAMSGSVIQIRPQAARPPPGSSQPKHRQCDRGLLISFRVVIIACDPRRLAWPGF
jgi:hypothetical protein